MLHAVLGAQRDPWRHDTGSRKCGPHRPGTTLPAVASALRLRSRAARLRRLCARYRTDGRLPPIVFALLHETIELFVRDAVDRLLARFRPVLGRRTGAEMVARRGRRWQAVAGPLTSSSQQLTHEVAGRVTAALRNANIDAFLVDRDGERLVFGLLTRVAPGGLARAAGVRRRGWLVRRLGTRQASRHRRAAAWLARRPAEAGDQMVDLPGVGGWERRRRSRAGDAADVLGTRHVGQARDDRCSRADALRHPQRADGGDDRWPGVSRPYRLPGRRRARALQRRRRRRLHVGGRI